MNKIKEFSTQLKEQVQGMLQAWSAKKEIPEKIEALNAYAEENKKRTLVIAFCITFLLFLFSIVMSLRSCHSPKEEPIFPVMMKDDVGELITSKQRIEEVKQQHVNEERSILLQGKQLQRELDSLIAIPHKTHRDSLEIVRKHKQLEHIVKYLNE